MTPATGLAAAAGPVHMVLVHHDQPASCARSVDAFARQPEVGSITVVDSSADARSRQRLRALLPSTEIVDGGGNIGFGPGANAGLRRWLDDGAGEWVGLAPHDAVPADGSIGRILDEVAVRPDAGLACGEFGEGYDLVPVVDKVIGGYYRPAHRGNGWQDVDYPHGTLLLARRATLEQIGLFDERYFAYCEEVDLGLRATRAGWRVGLVWGAVVTNSRLPAQLLADYLQVRNTLLLVREHFGPREVRARLLLAGAQIMTKAVKEPSLALRHGRLEGRAIIDFLAGRFGPPPASVVRLALGTRTC